VGAGGGEGRALRVDGTGGGQQIGSGGREERKPTASRMHRLVLNPRSRSCSLTRVRIRPPRRTGLLRFTPFFGFICCGDSRPSMGHRPVGRQIRPAGDHRLCDRALPRAARPSSGSPCRPGMPARSRSGGRAGPVWPIEWRTVGELGVMVCALAARAPAVVAAHCPDLHDAESSRFTFTPRPRSSHTSAVEDQIVRRHFSSPPAAASDRCLFDHQRTTRPLHPSPVPAWRSEGTQNDSPRTGGADPGSPVFGNRRRIFMVCGPILNQRPMR